MEITACVILGVLMGVIIGQFLGQFLAEQHFKKVLKNKQCRACKNFEECLGNWKKADENGNCKCFIEKAEDKQVKEAEEKNTLQNIETTLEELGFYLSEHIESIEEDISRIEGAIWRDGED